MKNSPYIAFSAATLEVPLLLLANRASTAMVACIREERSSEERSDGRADERTDERSAGERTDERSDILAVGVRECCASALMDHGTVKCRIQQNPD